MPAMRLCPSPARLALATLPLWLAACATPPPPPVPDYRAPAQWQAPLPHNGRLADLSRWWQQQNDPLLVRLIEAAQAASPSVASAGARLAQARATRVGAGAALGPSVDASAALSRGVSQESLVFESLGTLAQGTLQASWELDLFGGGRARRDAAQARLDGAQADWHDARVSVAAEVATQYSGLRSCRQQLAVNEADAASRAETARLTGLSAQAGFAAPAQAALARASAADAAARLTQQRTECDHAVKALVALTALDEPALRDQLATAPAAPPPEAPFAIAALPAQVLAQRPDLLRAEREVAAASADVGSAEAEHYPRLTLTGSVGRLQFSGGGNSLGQSTWSVGPLTLSLPLYDGGRRSANVEAARTRYDAAAVQYRALARQAVREVEQALLALASTAARSDDARHAVAGYRQAFESTAARQRSGLASLVELEDARRTLLAAETGWVALQRERMAAWIALYRAAGGGWSAAAPGPQATPASSPDPATPSGAASRPDRS